MDDRWMRARKVWVSRFRRRHGATLEAFVWFVGTVFFTVVLLGFGWICVMMYLVTHQPAPLPD